MLYNSERQLFAYTLKTVLAAITIGGLVSCTTTSTGRGLSGYQNYDRPTMLPNNPNNVVVKVSTSRQRVYVKEGDRMLLVMPVSVGTSRTPTPSGKFTIFRKVAKHRANSHGISYNGQQAKRSYVSSIPRGWKFKGTPMPYWCEFKAHYGFHTGWVKHTPCTHGCIRMHENLAPKFYRLVKVGTPVYISHSQPEDAQHAEIPLPPDAGPLPDYPWDMYLGDGYFTRHKQPVYSDS